MKNKDNSLRLKLMYNHMMIHNCNDSCVYGIGNCRFEKRCDCIVNHLVSNNVSLFKRLLHRVAQ
jgi:hypothetical protein